VTFTVVSTFSGCGGSSLGYKQAGGRVLLAVDHSEEASETYRLNFPGATVHVGDVAKLGDDEALRLAGVAPGELDVLDGSPPCQGYSTIGRRAYFDDRNALFLEFARLARAFRPRVLVMENVSGLAKGKMRLIFASMLRELRSCGYRVRCCLMNAAAYGVPQARERLIFIGARDDLGLEPSHPRRQTGPTSIREALELDSRARYGVFVLGFNAGALVYLGRPSPTISRLSFSGTYHMGFAIPAPLKPDGHPLAFLPAPPIRGKALRIAAGLASSARSAEASGERSGKVLPRPVAVADLSRSGTARDWPTSFSASSLRRLSIGEVRRLQSFPDDFAFPPGTRWAEAWAQLGNSVPPRMMRAIAEHVRSTLLEAPSREEAHGA
jgi:DNA (cytosine-5)-methyltransferase 1